MITNIFLLLSGILLLYAGGELLIKGAVSAADRFGVSPLFSGLVIVGLGTSTPELIVSLQAALQGSPDIAIGNIVGSNISNTLLIGGVCAMIAPLVVTKKMIIRDGTAMTGAVVLLLFMSADGVIGFLDGVILLISLTAYLIYTYKDEQQKSPITDSDTESQHSSPIYLILIQIISGLVLLMTGSDLLITGAVGIAEIFQLSEAMIGLTIVAAGTSTPELTIAAMAAWKGKADLAIGNIIGSNIYNLLGILGITSVVHAIPVARRMVIFDQWFLLAITLILVIFMITGRKITRTEGVLFFTGYVAYIAASFFMG